MLRRMNLLNILGNLINPATYDAQVDGTQRATVLGYEHDKIHSGNHYQIADYVSGISSGQIVNIALTTPADRDIHLSEGFYSLSASIEIYEGADVEGGTSMAIPNNNRQSPNVSGVVFLYNPTVNDQGDKLYGGLAGSGKVAGNVERVHEIELARSTTYLFVATSLQNGNVLSWDLNFYEEFD